MLVGERPPVPTAEVLMTVEVPFTIDSVPLLALVAVGTVSSVLVSEVWIVADALADGLAVSFSTEEEEEEEEDASELAAEVSLTAATDVEVTDVDVGVAGYICASNTMTSAGRSLYHCGVKVPVGSASAVSVPVGDGIAVLSTERIESLVGSIVAGSISRATRSPTTWTFLAEALAASAMMGRIVVGFMFGGRRCRCEWAERVL